MITIRTILGDRHNMPVMVVNNSVNNPVDKLEITVKKIQNQSYSQLFSSYSQDYSQFLYLFIIGKFEVVEFIHILTTPYNIRLI